MSTPAKPATNEQECALWYWRYHAMQYDLYDGEPEAARTAAAMEEYGDGVPVGVQFSDGRTVRADDWPAYDEARRAFLTAERSQADAQRARPTRRITDPFNGKLVTVDADEPSWLGNP